MTINNGEFLWIGGHLAEQDDTSANDSLGFIDNKIPHDVIASGTQRVHYQESQQKADAIFKIALV
jgi:hypothetical protein